MFLERTYGLTARNGLRNRKTLALAGALVLVLGAFVLAGREARAQQQSVVVSRHTVEIDGEVIEPTVTTPPAEEMSPVQTPPEKAMPTPVLRYDPVLSPEPTIMVLDPTPESTLPAGTELALDPVPEMEDPTPVTAPDLVPAIPVFLESAPPVALTPEPANVEEYEPLPPPLLETPAAPTVPVLEEEEAPLLTSPRTTEEAVLEPGLTTGAVETLQGAAADVLGDLADGTLFGPASEDEGLVDTVLAGLSSGGEEIPTPISERAGTSDAPSGGTEVPPRSSPQPMSPFALPPVGGGSFSLSGGDIGAGGVQLLLLCVLVSGLVLSRRDSGLSWGFWEPPKPGSALLLPLERPG